MEREPHSALFAPELRSLATTRFDQRDSGRAAKIYALQYTIMSTRGVKTE